jgi:translation initiation factor 4E
LCYENISLFQQRKMMTELNEGTYKGEQNGRYSTDLSKYGHLSGNDDLDSHSHLEEKVASSVSRHPLQHSWTLWYDQKEKGSKSSSWAANIIKVLTFSTVEEFWELYNHVVPASKLAEGSNYHLFKENIQPAWEDPENTKGGRWMINYEPSQRQEIDVHWLYTVLGCIGGGTFQDNSQICGCVITARPKGQLRISIWTKNAKDVETTKKIGYAFSNLLEVDKKALEYAQHYMPNKGNPEYEKILSLYLL